MQEGCDVSYVLDEPQGGMNYNVNGHDIITNVCKQETYKHSYVLISW